MTHTFHNTVIRDFCHWPLYQHYTQDSNGNGRGRFHIYIGYYICSNFSLYFEDGRMIKQYWQELRILFVTEKMYLAGCFMWCIIHNIRAYFWRSKNNLKFMTSLSKKKKKNRRIPSSYIIHDHRWKLICVTKELRELRRMPGCGLHSQLEYSEDEFQSKTLVSQRRNSETDQIANETGSSHTMLLQYTLWIFHPIIRSLH
jgi:hypothetical protein